MIINKFNNEKRIQYMKNVIITGAANGIGKSIAKTLKEENLILVDNDKESLIKIANDLNKEYFICDLSNDEERFI